MTHFAAGCCVEYIPIYKRFWQNPYQPYFKKTKHDYQIRRSIDILFFLFFEAYLSTTYVPATLVNPLLCHAVGQWQLPVGIFPSHKVAENESMSMPFPSCSDILVQNHVTFSHIHKRSISCEDFRYLI